MRPYPADPSPSVMADAIVARRDANAAANRRRDDSLNAAPEREVTDLTASGLEYIGDYDDDAGLTYTPPTFDRWLRGGA